MQMPLRLANAMRTSVEPGLVISTAVATAVFIATPLVMPDIIDEFSIGTGQAGFVSGVQLLGFVLTSFLAGRFLRPSSRIFVLACALLAASNLASALVSGYGLFLATRGLAGLALGILTWLAWTGVFGDPERMGDIAVIGPVAGVVAAPLIGFALEDASLAWVYAALGMISLVPLVRIPSFADEAPVAGTVRRKGGSRAAFVLVGALGFVTLGGSAVFVFGGVIARDEVMMSPTAFSLVMALNAAAGIPSARWKGPRRGAGSWFVVTGAMAIVVSTAPAAWLLTLAFAAWGFSFWFALPGTYKLLSDRSIYPSQRAGDAQAVMAIGRIVGPVLGGALVASGSFLVLGIVGGGLMISAAAVILAVELYPSASA